MSTTMTDTVEGWHFTGATLRDGRPLPADGEWLEHSGPLVMCERGLHLSERLRDALAYAPGNTLCRVTGAGDILRDTDKLVCSRRRIEWRIDAETVLRAFARRCALDVIHLWDAPDIVRRYLETGDESIRDVAAWAAARDAAMDAAWGAARAAAWGAAWAAARAAARAPAWAAARDAARAAQNKLLIEMVTQKRNQP